MRHLLFVLPFAILPGFVLAAEHHDHHDDHHSSLDAHEHGAAEMDAALDGSTLEIELRSPAMNLVGFEHAANSDADKRKVADARNQLEQPDALFGLSAAAGCTLTETKLESPLFVSEAHDQQESHDGQHSDVHAQYRYRCSDPQSLKGVDLRGLFQAFPGTKKIQTQLIGPNGQRGAQLQPEKARANF